MTAEFGGLNGIFAPDGLTAHTMARRWRKEFRDGGWWFEADEDASYVEAFVIDLGDLAPQVAKPFSPDNVFNVEDVIGQKLDGCFIGACTTAQDELIIGALVLEAGLNEGFKPIESPNRIVVPGSIEVRRNLYEAGLLDVYQRAGFRAGDAGCSMCLGIASDRAQPGEVWLSSQNRNFPNRMGKGSLAWLASAATVAASAFDMTIVDPRALLEKVDQSKWEKLTLARDLPSVALDIPHAPAANGSKVEPVNNGHRTTTRISGRAQLFGDHVDTDAIIPGEFCHLSDLNEIGEKAFYHVRPDFVERVRRGEDIIVAGEGWGSGSSREHAAWALKGAGVKAVIAKSFAYIHKRNLVNEAIPFIILRDEDFYARVSDGSALEIDLERGAVVLNGATYHGEALPHVMTEIMAHGGLVEYVKLALE
jgi:aconitate hydratase/homoaconitate hydratase